jgi:hypothetical protein
MKKTRDIVKHFNEARKKSANYIHSAQIEKDPEIRKADYELAVANFGEAMKAYEELTTDFCYKRINGVSRDQYNTIRNTLFRHLVDLDREIHSTDESFGFEPTKESRELEAKLLEAAA